MYSDILKVGITKLCKHMFFDFANSFFEIPISISQG